MQQQIDVTVCELEELARKLYKKVASNFKKKGVTRLFASNEAKTAHYLLCAYKQSVRFHAWLGVMDPLGNTRCSREHRSILHTPEESSRVGSDVQRCIEKRAMILHALQILQTVVSHNACRKHSISDCADPTCSKCSS